MDELNLLLANLSSDLSQSTKRAQDQLVETEVSSRAVQEAKRQLEDEKCRFDDETVARREAERAVEAAKLEMVRAETARVEGDRALAGFQEARESRNDKHAAQ